MEAQRKKEVSVWKIPKQLCFVCRRLFQPYMVDDELWNKLPKKLRTKYICPTCLRKNIR